MTDLNAVVVGCGPGPFTGLRVGMATAAAYGQALGIPVHGVCTLDAIARATHGEVLVVTGSGRKPSVPGDDIRDHAPRHPGGHDQGPPGAQPLRRPRLPGDQQSHDHGAHGQGHGHERIAPREPEQPPRAAGLDGMELTLRPPAEVKRAFLARFEALARDRGTA